MWMLVGTIGLLGLVVLALKVMERRAAKDEKVGEDLSTIAMKRLGRGDLNGGGWGGDGSGVGW